MARLLLPILAAFTGILSTLAMSRPFPVLPRFDLLELGVGPEYSVDSPHLLHHDLPSPSSAPEAAQLPRRHGSKAELATARFIAGGFAAAIVAAVAVYIRITRRRAAENSKY
ncbi:hypothetical protein KSP39_PZI003323 [Platanthera zijinensis]|uniref:Uncharacterized protein n=1 Tax=Platanthera zijinensis TaxID=2320716 RepID=A0AAP0GCG5_9ASPA